MTRVLRRSGCFWRQEMATDQLFLFQAYTHSQIYLELFSIAYGDYKNRS